MTALALAGAVAACDAAFGPERSRGVYVLQQINGNPVPAVVTAHEFGVTEILADTLWLETESTGVRRVTYRSTDSAGDSMTYRSEDPFTYQLSGMRIEIAFACRDLILNPSSAGFASCIAPPHFAGEVEPDGMRGEGLHRNRMRYRRLW